MYIYIIYIYCFIQNSQKVYLCFGLCRVLVQICKTRAFQKLNPAQFDLHVEVTDAVVVSNTIILITIQYKDLT